MNGAASTWLASVTSADEARLALDAGAGIIDAKNPQSGALGALPMRAVLGIVDAASRHSPVSATLGDLVAMEPRVLRAAALDMAATGVDIVKVGLFPAATLGACIDGMAAISARHRLVGVVFADRLDQYPESDPLVCLPPRLAAAGWFGVMLDTSDKRSGGLLRHCAAERLAAFVSLARRLGLHCGLAGSLTLSDIPALLAIGPDALGFRGALCSTGQRTHALDADRLAAVAEAMRAAPSTPARPVRADGRHRPQPAAPQSASQP